MSAPRERLEPPEWPDRIRATWEETRSATELFDEAGGAQHWASATRRLVERGLGLYLGFLSLHRWLRQDLEPADLLNVTWLKGYAEYCAKRKLRPASQVTRFNMLNETLRVMAPLADRTTLVRVLRRLQKVQRAQPRRPAPPVSSSDLYAAGIARMDRVATAKYEKRDVQAIQYGDGLMMAMLAAKPLRISTVTRTDIDVHLVKIAGRYRWSFDALETKNAQPSRSELPERLTPYIDRWLDTFRPTLLKGSSSPAMWISCYRGRMSTATLYARFCAATVQELGERINPHKVRKIVATSVAVSMPEEARIILQLLDHRSDAVAKRHYIIANSLSASARYLACLEKRRAEARSRRSRSAT
jgi:hypothetical protein